MIISIFYQFKIINENMIFSKKTTCPLTKRSSNLLTFSQQEKLSDISKCFIDVLLNFQENFRTVSLRLNKWCFIINKNKYLKLLSLIKENEKIKALQ